MSIKRTLAVVCIAVLASLANTETSVAASSSNVQVWWPSNGVQVTGTQPFKAMLENTPVENYQMFWQVDGGQWVWMDSDYNGYPHKEAQVNLSDWNWRGSGPYRVNFIARNFTGTIISMRAVDIYTGNQQPSATPLVVSTPKPTPVPTPVSTPVVVATPLPTPTPVFVAATPAPAPTATPISSANPLANAKLYVNPYSDPQKWANDNRYSRPEDARLMDKIGAQAESQWFGDWNKDVYTDAKNVTNTVTATGATPVYVIYNIPHRDCGSYSAGGASDIASYGAWIKGLVDGIGGRKAVAILEPDALAGMDCLSAQAKADRITMLKEAVTTLESRGVAVYIDAGNPKWIGVDEMAGRLKAAGIDQAHGFALNTSNFMTTADNISYGTAISSKVNGKHFIIDTGRNGSGPTSDYQWCNPTGRSLGQRPTTNTGNSLVDAYLWLKGPGGSDGACGNGAPSAGVFWPEYALDLARRTSW